MLKKILLLSLLCLSNLGFAQAPLQPIPVDQAFDFSAEVKDPSTISVNWKIAPGYHLYKDRFSYKIVAPDAANLGDVALPPGIPAEDDILGKYEIYNDQLNLNIPVSNATGNEVTLWICYQGCSESNFCYPPETKQITLNLSNPNDYTDGRSIDGVSKGTSLPISEQDRITELLNGNSLWLILLSFLGFGLLLSFTPCVLPMIPILSGIIIGHGHHISTRKAFVLSLIYVLGMSITYALIGVLAGFAGSSLQVAFQQPWVIALFSLVFVLLAFSLFGFYEIKLPSRFQEKISDISNHQKSGSYLGVAVMGILSTLIVSPCVTAPLMGALAYIGNTGDAVLGGSALFAMGLGMGIPLLIIGTSSGKLLPRAGTWMDTVKAFFGVLLLAVAIFMISRIIPGPLTLLLWAGLLIVSSVYMGLLNSNVKTGWENFWRGLGLLFAIYGVILMLGAAMGNNDPLAPLAHTPFTSVGTPAGSTAVKSPAQLFTRIKSNDDFDDALNGAVSQNKYVMLDFYADWCIACKEMERKTFANPEVQAKLADMELLQADVTANDVIDKALLERLRVVAPPTILFFDSKGNEVSSHRIVGEMGPEKFKQHVDSLMNQ